jgi:hypothetical protein
LPEGELNDLPVPNCDLLVLPTPEGARNDSAFLDGMMKFLLPWEGELNDLL